MKGYGQFCPVAKAAEIIAQRWTPLVLRELLVGSRRFNDLRRGLPLMSPSLLSARLKSLEQLGILARDPQGDGGQVEYRLTPAGEELRPLIMQLGVWGRRWAQSGLQREDLDPALLMWDMHRRVDTSHYGRDRVVVLVEFTDLPQKQRRWWLVIAAPDVELCLLDPGYEIDLQITADLETLSRIWIGDDSFEAAQRGGQVKILGPGRLKQTFIDSLQYSVFAHVERPG